MTQDSLIEIGYGAEAKSDVLDGNFEYLDTKVNSKADLSDVETLSSIVSTLNNTVASLQQSISGGAIMPTGTIIFYGLVTPPTGYLLCDGRAVSRTTYASLFSVIGITFGSGDGSTTFNLPNLTDDRFVKGTTAVGSYGDAQVGTHNHTASCSEKSHSHTYSGTSVNTTTNQILNGEDSFGTYATGGSSWSGTSSTDTHSHNITINNNADNVENTPKFLGLLPCIKY